LKTSIESHLKGVAFYYALKTVYPINHQVIVGVNRGVMNRVYSLENIIALVHHAPDLF